MNWDVIIIGAGGAGLYCAIEAGRRGLTVLILDHGKKAGGKILISGGGRCNFTNIGASHKNYVSQNPDFCRGPLKRFPPEKFIQLVERHEIPYHEKKLGQLFCDRSASDILQMLLNEIKRSGAELKLETNIVSVKKESESFVIETNQETFTAKNLVVATGGLSIPKMGATGFGYELAQKFGHTICPTSPALDGFMFEDNKFDQISGVAIDCILSCGEQRFRENILFTHKGLSGPAALQASLHWHEGMYIEANLFPEEKNDEFLVETKKSNPRILLTNALGEEMPKSLVAFLTQELFSSFVQKPLQEISDKDLRKIVASLRNWRLRPSGTVGYSKAEVTRGGVDTKELHSQTMESKLVPGLYFIGEVVDVTGWLGGYNFQWAWASAWVAAQSIK